MMKLYIREKVFSWNDKFTVKDETGADCYVVEGEIFTLGNKLHVYDMQGREAAFIRQKLLSLLPRYDLFIHGEHRAQIKREFSIFPRYTVEGLGWEANGSFMAHDYEIARGGSIVATIRKEWMTWGDSYELDIADPRDALAALAVVLTIDCVMESSDSSNN